MATISWRQIHGHDAEGGFSRQAARPCGRDIWGNSFTFGGAIYIFGGAWERYGRSEHWRDHAKLGVGNDLWRFDPAGETWSLLEEDDRSLAYAEGARRPGGRMLASFSVAGDYAYLFGGLAVLERGFMLRALNDFWRYHVPTGRWELLYPDTAWCQFIARQTRQPPIRGAHCAAVIGGDIYLFGGWPGTVPEFMANDFWRYDTVKGHWEQRSPLRGCRQGAGYRRNAEYPGARYCANLFAHGGALYLFAGRDTAARNPEFFNDLWRYEPSDDRWTLLQSDDGNMDFRSVAGCPPPRYGSGHAVLGDDLYIFGGHNAAESVERNDFWRYRIPDGRWEQLHADDGGADYGAGQRYPPVRRVAVLELQDNALFLFGGINCFMGPKAQGYSLPLNDLWRCDVGP